VHDFSLLGKKIPFYRYIFSFLQMVQCNQWMDTMVNPGAKRHNKKRGK